MLNKPLNGLHDPHLWLENYTTDVITIMLNGCHLNEFLKRMGLYNKKHVVVIFSRYCQSHWYTKVCIVVTNVGRIFFSETKEEYTEKHHPWYSWYYLGSYFHDLSTKHTSLMFNEWPLRSNKQQSTAGWIWRCTSICFSIQHTIIKYLPGNCLSVWDSPLR